MGAIVLKLSGEILGGPGGVRLDHCELRRVAGEIARGKKTNQWLGIVVGAGNFIRGSELASAGIPRQRADFMGMTATVLNGLALASALQAEGLQVKVLSAVQVGGVVEGFSETALEATQGSTVIFAGGTGNPYLTTDTAASLRALQMGAEMVLKGTKVDGVYSKDPEKEPDAEFFKRLSFEEVLRLRLKVMDLTAITLCMEHQLPVRVVNAGKPDNLVSALRGEDVGTLVGA